MLDLGLSTTSSVTILAHGPVVTPPYPSPSGYRWDAVTENSAIILEDEPVIELVRIAE